MLMLLLCNVFTLSAAEELYAQHYNVTLSLRNATVKEAVDAVTRQTGIAFSYESSVGVMPLGNVEIRVDGGAVDALSLIHISEPRDLSTSRMPSSA